MSERVISKKRAYPKNKGLRNRKPGGVGFLEVSTHVSSDVEYSLEATRRQEESVPGNTAGHSDYGWFQSYGHGRSFRELIKDDCAGWVVVPEAEVFQVSTTVVWHSSMLWGKDKGTLSWHCSWCHMMPPYWFSVSGHCFPLCLSLLPPQANSVVQLGGRGLEDKLPRGRGKPSLPALAYSVLSVKYCAVSM